MGGCIKTGGCAWSDREITTKQQKNRIRVAGILIIRIYQSY
jgi:hypothetical protein